jgi:hypothetical protein
MNIEITTKEYRDLLDILHLADVVMSGHRREEDIRTGRHRALIQKLYALAKEQGLDQLIDYNEGTNRYAFTEDFERSTLVHAVINEFGDHLFWDELIDKLSMRDAMQVVGGIDSLNAMNDSDRQHLEGPIRQRYIEEFTANGVANLAIIERFSTRGNVPVKTSD